MTKLALALGCTLVACSGEYDVVAEADAPPPTSNPKPLESSHREDRIRQVGVPKVDVLWVVDNSCSMWEEQTALAENFPSFLQFFVGSGLDYHIGVVSTDMIDVAHQGRLRQVDGYRFIDDESPDPHLMFTEMAQMGTTGHWDEKGFEAVFAAVDIEGEGYNAGFLREAASLHVVVISDENDYSSWTSPEFSAWLRGKKASSTLVSFSSIVGPEEDCPNAAEPGLDYLEVTRSLSGVEWPICSSEWSTVLEHLGLKATGLTSEFFLTDLPVDETIEVSVEIGGVVFGFEPAEDWIYDDQRNSIQFLEYVPDPLALVVIRYQVDGT